MNLPFSWDLARDGVESCKQLWETESGLFDLDDNSEDARRRWKLLLLLQDLSALAEIEQDSDAGEVQKQADSIVENMGKQQTQGLLDWCLKRFFSNHFTLSERQACLFKVIVLLQAILMSMNAPAAAATTANAPGELTENTSKTTSMNVLAKVDHIDGNDVLLDFEHPRYGSAQCWETL